MLDDLQHRISFLLAERTTTMGMARMKVVGELAKQGQASSSSAMLRKERLAEQSLDEGIIELVVDVQKARIAGAPPEQLRELLNSAASQLVENIRTQFTESGKAPGYANYGPRPEKLAALEERATSLVRQYWAGYLTHPGVSGSTYNIAIHGSTGVAIQQGGHGNTQTVTQQVDLAAAREAAAALAPALAGLGDAPGASDALADLQSLQAQLSKADPKPQLVAEIGKSLRTVMEGALGSMFGEQGLAAAALLWAAIGV